ncbi:MAG TPA: 1-(5-phosphoribosyl)-5-[(5-phosphoribosylamino)methylideneamino]imidazole-4-carboxamide isomerase [Bacteroidia bacterium]
MKREKFELIPAIDLMDGKCVRLTQGDYSRKTIYNEDPLEMALQMEAVGIRRLHLVDLDGAKNGKPLNLIVLEQIAKATRLKIDFGGGIKTDEDIENVYNAGAALATIGSVAVKNPTLFDQWLHKYGAEKIFLGVDVKDECVAISGWQEQTTISAFEFIGGKLQKGVDTVFCTDISKDGLLQGPSFDLYEKMLSVFPNLKLVASGGIATIENVIELKEIGCSGVIIGKAIYEGRIGWKELEKLNLELC